MKFVQKNLLAIVGVAIVLFGGGYYLSQNKPAPKQQTSTTSTTNSEAKKTVVTVTIKEGANEKNYQLTSGVGKTVLEVTQSATDGQVVTKGTGVNAYVTSINGREASSDKKEFWEMKINDKSAEVGAGSYIVKEGDKIGWKISTY